MNAGTRDRERFFSNMEKVAIGAKLSHKGRLWTVANAKRTETGVALDLSDGADTLRKYVPVCHTGPCLFDADLQFVRFAPRQTEIAA